VTYTTAGRISKRDDFFAFITVDMRLNCNSCHVFYLGHGKSEEVCKVLSRAFMEYAKQFRGNDAFLPTSVRSTDAIPAELTPFQVCR
jgi:hypothetical protein